MNAKVNLTLGIVGFAVILGGSAWLYRSLSGRYAPNVSLSGTGNETDAPESDTPQADSSDPGQDGGDATQADSSDPQQAGGDASQADSSDPGQDGGDTTQADPSDPQQPGGDASQADSSDPEQAEIPAPDFSVEDYDGNVINFSDFAGKPVVINFWASWCPPCKAELPSFNTVHARLGEDVVFMMIDSTDGIRETKDKAKELIEEEGYTFPVYYDTEMEASYTYGVTSLPSTVFIAADGNIAASAVGMIDEATLLRGIDMIYDPEQ